MTVEKGIIFQTLGTYKSKFWQNVSPTFGKYNHNILLGNGAIRNCIQACKKTALETKKKLFY